MSDLDNRVTKLEVRVDGHDKEITKLGSDNETLKLGFLEIKQNLAQIKWVVVGAGAAYAFQLLDLKDFIKLIFAFL